MQLQHKVRNTALVFLGSMMVTWAALKPLTMAFPPAPQAGKAQLLSGNERYMKDQLQAFAAKGDAYQFASEHFVPCALGDHRVCMANAISQAKATNGASFARDVFQASLEWDTAWQPKQNPCDAQKSGYMDAQYDFCKPLGGQNKKA
ncbi:hypothetical protein ACKF11_13195 [Methylobacillus sp. Pita2]|uniref:hypothetical protein n=1 Tax=Methylobacillus sp. Pita2 TaxID=3383245 RepID=UPI0038B58F45